MASRSTPGRTVGRVSQQWRGLGALVVGIGLATGSAAAASGATAAPPPRAPVPTMTDCQNLLRQFDVAWPAHRQSPRAASARHGRDLGENECRESRFADGVHHLRRALYDIGVKPVKSVGVAPTG